VSWARRFEEPVELPDGRKLRTLAEAMAWLAKEIPKSEKMEKVQTAAHLVTRAAEHSGRANDLRADGNAAGDPPSSEAGIQSRSQRPPLRKAKIETRSVSTVRNLHDKKNRQRARSSDSSVAIPWPKPLPRQTMPTCARQQQDQVTNYKLVLI